MADRPERAADPMNLSDNVLFANPNAGKKSLDFNAGPEHKNVFATATDEKHEKNEAGEKSVSISIEGDEYKEEFDPFVPFPVDSGVEEGDNILRVRSIVLGCLCGALVNASNVYLGLKTGWTFSANLFGAIVGFAVIKFFSVTFAENFPILGGKFGPKENNIIQTSATAAGGLSSIFVSAIPAMYQLDLLSANPKNDYWKITSFTAVCAYFGFCFATPLRKFFVIYVARELRLIFPTGTATAMTIRSMHAATGGAEMAKKKTKALGIAFTCAICLRMAGGYATGILWDWHFFTWFYIWSGYSNQALAVENWGWYLEWTPAFIGSGMLVGLNPAISFFSGAVIAWGIVGPTLVHYNMAFGKTLYPDDPQWGGVVSFASMNLKDPVNAPSPRYWLLWPGVLTMIVVSFTELFCQYQVIFFAGKAVTKGMANGINALLSPINKQSTWLERKGRMVADDSKLVHDPAPEEDQVKVWMWAPGLLLVIILMCSVLALEFQMPVGDGILAVILGFMFSFLAIQCTGVTDTTPLTAASKASQIVLGGATRNAGFPLQQNQLMNLAGGTVASGAANQATDLTVDFRVGFLLRTPPKLQWVAQGIGSLVAIFLAPGMFVLFASAYPCILDAQAETCAFAAPSVSAWRAVTIAMTKPTLPIPSSSGIFAICFALVGACSVVFRIFFLTGTREKYKKWVPNFMAMALSFTLPQTQYGTAMVLGATISYVWATRHGVSFDHYCYAVAAGFIAGEGIGGVLLAVLQVAGVGPDLKGTNLGCPALSC